MAQDETYQTLVYMEQGGNRLVAGSGGEITLESGAVFSMVSSANWGLAGGDIAVDDLRRLLVSEFGTAAVVITPALASVKLTGQNNLPRNARIVTVIGSVTMSKASLWLTSVSAGREVYLRLVGDLTGTFTNNNTSLAVLRSGCILLGSIGAPIASFTMHTSGASDCGVFLRAIADDVWAIVREIGNNLVES